MVAPTPTDSYPDLTTATFTEVGSPSIVNGVLGNATAYDFSGSGQYLTSSEQPFLGGGNVSSATACNMKFDSADWAGVDQVPYSQWFGTGNNAFTWEIQSGGDLFFVLYSDDSDTRYSYCQIDSGINNWDDGEWHRVYGRWNKTAGKAEIWIDGVQASAYVAQSGGGGGFNGFPVSNTTTLRVASRHDGTQPFNGVVDSIQFYEGQEHSSDEIMDENLLYSTIPNTANDLGGVMVRTLDPVYPANNITPIYNV